MAKLYELLNKSYGTTFEIVVGSETVELKLKNFSVEQLMIYEERGLSITDLVTNLQQKPATFGTMVGWDLLTDDSKVLFDNDLALFRQCLSIDNLTKLSDAIGRVLLNSNPPIEKNAAGPTE